MEVMQWLKEYRKSEDDLAWHGTFKDYLPMVIENPDLSVHAHARFYAMISKAGIEKSEEGLKYHFFDSELFGLDKTLERLVEEYFHSAAKRLDVRKRILLLMGPVSGGKSTIVSMLKQGIEAFSRTEAGAVYALEGCPMHEDPLHLLPFPLREKFAATYGIRVEGSLCPVCRMRLEEEFNGDLEQFPVQRVLFSEANRVGIGTFAPSDPKSQDIADLTGSIDFSTITEYGSESDPRAYRFDGELNKANRGMIEFQEMLKCDEKFLWSLLSLSQEGNFKAGRFALISADTLVIAHTNEAEYRTFAINRKNEALQSRIIVLPVPYNLKVSEEVKIYEKLIRQSDLSQIHLAPHSLWTAAVFSILSRLQPSKKQGMELIKKMRLYDGEGVDGFNEKDLRDLMTEGEEAGEGMSGVDPRYVINRISTALVRNERQCINALDILRALKEGLSQHTSITKEERERLMNLIVAARQEYDNVAKKEVQKAFVYAYEESAKSLLNNYLDNVEGYCNSRGITDLLTGEEREADEQLMRSVEEQIGVSENAKKAFREEILIRISMLARKGRTFDYTSHEKLKEAIEKKLFTDLKDIVKVTTSVSHPDREQQKRINDVTDRLIEQHGYCPVCANEIVKYVGSLLNR